jgi:hypothetical protein
MIETRPLSSLSRRALWLAAVTAALTGFWFTAWAVAYANSEGELWPLAVGTLVLSASLVGWSRLGAEASDRLIRAAIAVFFGLVAVFAVGFPVVILAVYACGEGQGVSILRPTALLIPAAYYALGYYGFARPQRLLYVWPLAVAAGLLAFLAFDLVWKATSGCGPA